MADQDMPMESPPVAQLGDVFRHLGPLLDKNNLKILAPMMHEQDAQPAKRSKGPTPKGKGKGKGKNQRKSKDDETAMTDAIQTLGKLVLRLDMQMRQQNLTCCLICFINNREESILPSLIQTFLTWKQLSDQGKALQSLKIGKHGLHLSRRLFGGNQLLLMSTPLLGIRLLGLRQKQGSLEQALNDCLPESRSEALGPGDVLSHDASSSGGCQVGGPAEPGSVSMEASAQSKGGRPMEYPRAAPGQCSLELDQAALQALESEAERIGNTAGPTAESPEIISFLDQGDMLVMMTQMKLCNLVNFCYCNATMYCLWWAILSRCDYSPGDWNASRSTTRASSA
eukprot:s2178_g11.t1